MGRPFGQGRNQAGQMTAVPGQGGGQGSGQGRGQACGQGRGKGQGRGAGQGGGRCRAGVGAAGQGPLAPVKQSDKA